MKEHLKSVPQAVRILYSLIITMSLTRAISSLLLVNGNFAFPTVDQLVLFGIFCSFITRFFFGQYRILTEDIEIELRRSKIVVDAVGFFIQAMLFYVYSLNYYGFFLSEFMIFSICTLDIVWLAWLALKDIKAPTFRQWMIHNFFFALFIPVNMFVFRSLILLAVTSLVAMIVDFVLNKNFYLPRPTAGLRIFVAGPYGDNEPKSVIAKNVRQARDVGKELALKGHFPFIPHTMLHGWETDDRFTISHFKSIDFTWLEQCDALYFIAPSAGANVEKEIATRKGLRVFQSLDDVPMVSR